jgi:predicted ribosome quality control (RQC) complex YloA/Tae2 family protein
VVALLEKHCKLDHNIEDLNEEEIRQLFLTIRKHKKLVKKWFKEYERFKSFSFY